MSDYEIEDFDIEPAAVDEYAPADDPSVALIEAYQAEQKKAAEEHLSSFVSGLREDVGAFDEAGVRAAIDKRVTAGELNDPASALREYRKLAEESAAARKAERKTYDGVIRSFVRERGIE